MNLDDAREGMTVRVTGPDAMGDDEFDVGTISGFDDDMILVEFRAANAGMTTTDTVEFDAADLEVVA
jgi:hypothetical protein